VYGNRGTWRGKSLEAMAADVRAGNDRAAAASPAIKGVVPTGEAWVRAIRAGIADANPYDGIDAGKLNLWTFDNHHASVYGYYLDALVLFGAVTGRDPRSLGGSECAGFELGLSKPQMEALQRVAAAQLSLLAPLAPPAGLPAAAAGPNRCARGR
jgi:hypothetical protein